MRIQPPTDAECFLCFMFISGAQAYRAAAGAQGAVQFKERVGGVRVMKARMNSNKSTHCYAVSLTSDPSTRLMLVWLYGAVSNRQQ